MDYDMKKPCECCPFRRGTAMRLTRARVGEVVGMMLNPNGGEFPCHRTIELHESQDGEYAGYSGKNGKGKHCAGALIFAEKNKTATQMMRICERIGMYDAEALMANQEVVDSVFDDYGEAFKHLTSPQPDELNKSVDKSGNRRQGSPRDIPDKRGKSDDGSKRRGRRVARDAVPRGQGA